MANTHSKSDDAVNKATKIERYYTVEYAPQNGRANPPSAINLKGRWLAEMGFDTGIPVVVTVERGRIIIETQINLCSCTKQQVKNNRKDH